jgi:hypothetical protein
MASLRSSFSRMLEEPLDGRDKVTHLKWLALKRVESGVCNLLPVGGHHRRGHRHDGNLSGGLLGSQLSERLDPIDPGESNVHQDQAWMALLGETDALFTRPTPRAEPSCILRAICENDREPDPPHGHLGGGWLAGV